MSSPSLCPQPPPEEDLQQQQHLQEAQEPLIMEEDPQTQIHEIENQPDQGLAPEEAQAEDQENPEAPKVQEFAELHVVLPITDPHVAVSERTVTTPSPNPQNRRGVNKRKKGKSNVKKQQAIEKKLLALMENLNPIPSIPPNMLNFSKHEKLLKRLGLWDFFHLEFDRDVRVDLVAQLVATYDPKLRCSYVNEFRIAVNRADMARAFKLPLKKEKGNVGGVESVDVDSELVSEDSKGFIEDFVSKCVLLHEDLWITPVEVVNWLRMIRKGHPEKVDWATLFWLMMEKELTKGERLGDCYYASHFQYLIKSQRQEVLLLREEETETEKVELNVEEKEEDGVNEEDVKAKEGDDGVNEEDVKAKEEDGVNEEDVKAKEEEDGVNEEDVKAKEEEDGVNDEDVKAKEEEDWVNEENVKAEEEEDGVNEEDVKAEEEEDEEDGVHKEDVKVEEEEDVKAEEDGVHEEEEEDRVNEEDVRFGVVREVPEVEGNVMDGLNFELTLGQDVVEEEEDMKDAEMIDVDKCKDDAELEERGRWDLDGKKNMERHFMERCSMEEDRGFGSLEDRKEDEGDMEEDEEEGEEGEEEGEDGLNILSNVNALERDGLTGNLLQTMEANLMGFSSQGQLRDHAMVDLRVDMRHMDSTAPFFNNNNTGKRVMEHDNDIPHHSLNDSNKRLRIDDTWDQKPVDFETCMAQMQHFMERARVMYEEKEQAQEHLSLNQQLLLNELQKRDNMIEHLHKAKLEEIQKRDRELYRYERELYLMGGILDGYRKALKETQRAFAEYRQRAQLPEEPLYKDAGPGGLMLSTGEIEKLREKQEEEHRMNCLILEQKAKEAEEDYTGQFEAFLEKINMLDKKLTGLETDAKELIDCNRKGKILKTEEKVSDVLEPLPNE